MDKWAVVFTGKDQRVANTFVEKSLEVSRKCGIKMVKPQAVKIDNDRAQVYCAAIKNCSNYQIVVVIFPSQRDDRYSAVKKLCNVDLGLPSQVR